jgi:hypothetical protein
MKKLFIVVFVTLLTLVLIPAAFSQSPAKVTLSGQVKDATTGEDLIGASVFLPEANTGQSTNVYGFYSISVPKGRYTVVISYVGYQTQKLTIDLTADQKLNLNVQPDQRELETVEVTAEAADQNVKEIQMSAAKLDVQTIRRVPALLGEVDVVRSILQLPGVTTVGEGASGFNVRGGNIDQNLILLDEAPVFNSSHLFGFFSVFNADAVKDVKLLKGGIPAEYGGRLSSVLDIRQREGNSKQFSGRGGLGLVSSRLTLEVPLVKDRMSVLVSGRRSYADVFTRLAANPNVRNSIGYFYDLNTKINYRFSDRSRLYASGYFGRDVFRFQQNVGFNWGNGTGTVRWNYLFSNRLFANFTALYSDYGYQLDLPAGTNSYVWRSRIRLFQQKADFNFYASDRHTVNFGLSNTYYTFTPARVEAKGDLNLRPVIIPDQYALEPAAYLSAESKLGDKLTVQYGIRYSFFGNYGPRGVPRYQPGVPMDRTTIIDTVQYGRGQAIAQYHGPEPRLAINYTVNDRQSLKFSYNRMRQYLHLVSNTTAALPFDVWAASSNFIKPQIADQVALGYFRNFRDNAYEASIETYYKAFQNQVDYKDGADLLLNRYLEADLLSGIGRAYGVELQVKKNKGRLTGWASYAYSRTERQVVGQFAEETINNGEWYAANFDQPHRVTAFVSYELSPKWTISANFTYQTGRPITLPNTRYVVDGIAVIDYSGRNNGRIPDYHRLDLSAEYTPRRNPNRRFYGSWNFSIYNAYGRRNPFSVYYRPVEGQANATETVQLSIIGTLIPSVTYNFNF